LRIYFSNKDNDDNWSERTTFYAALDSAAAWSSQVYYTDRQTMDNATVAASTGNLWWINDVLAKRIKVYVARPKTTDSVGYKAIYVLKLHQDQAR
jgi:hypothetical protein